MASSLIGGLLRAGASADSVCAADASAEQRDRVAADFGILVSPSNTDIARDCDVVVLAVKPQGLRDVAGELAHVLGPSQTVISVAAGIPGAALAQWLSHAGQTPALIRAMPNTPALLGAGATGLVAINNVPETGRAAATALFETAGHVEWVDDEQALDAVIAVSGSGPAYFFAFIEALADHGARLGLAPDVAQRLAVATANGAARMATETGTPVATLRQRVTSPGGTTAEALRAFSDGGLDALVARAMDAAVARARVMASELTASPDAGDAPSRNTESAS